VQGVGHALGHGPPRLEHEMLRLVGGVKHAWLA
jgi:hypothetical protein